MPPGTHVSRVRRGFVDVPEGQVHYRAAVGDASDPPIVLIHASPGSSRMLVPLIEALASAAPGRTLIAFDTLGNGDSCAPAVERPELGYFAAAHRAAIDAMGIAEFDLYGAHTGAGIAAEIAIAAPDRVRRLILDGMSLYAAEEMEEMLRHYAPGVSVDLNGSQLNWVWHFVRDTYLFWPWYRRDARHRRDIGLPDAMTLHEKAVEVLKAVTTYHLSYRASIGYDKAGRLPLLRVPTLVTCARNDMLFRYFAAIAALVPSAVRAENAGTANPDAAAETADLFVRFFDGGAGI